MNYNNQFNIPWKTELAEPFLINAEGCDYFEHFPTQLMLYIPPGSSYTYHCPKCNHPSVIHSWDIKVNYE